MQVVKTTAPQSISMPTNSDSSGSPGGRPGKVHQLIAEYELEDLGEELERRWTAPEDERESLRDLATYVNRQVLRRAMTDAGPSPLDGEVENFYRLLHSDDVGKGAREEARRRLEREGIDVDGVLDHFVSYQAVRTYLQNDRGVEYSSPDRDKLEADTEGLKRLAARTESIVLNTLEGLVATGRLSLGEFTVSVPIRITCKDCGSRFEVEKLLSRGSCDCP